MVIGIDSFREKFNKEQKKELKNENEICNDNVLTLKANSIIFKKRR